MPEVDGDLDDLAGGEASLNTYILEMLVELYKEGLEALRVLGLERELVPVEVGEVEGLAAVVGGDGGEDE